MRSIIATCVLPLGALVGCGQVEVETLAPQALAQVAQVAAALVVDDAAEGFSLLPEDDYHHYARSADQWRSVAGGSAVGGSALEAPCGDPESSAAASVALWQFDAPSGEHELSVFVPAADGPRQSAMYCVIWSEPSRESHCQAVSQREEGWVSLGRFTFAGRVEVALDPLVCFDDLGGARVVADAVKLSRTANSDI